MNGKNISDALTGVDAKFISESESVSDVKKKIPIWFLPAAASLILAVALSILIAKGGVNSKKLPVVSDDTTTAVEQTTSINEENTDLLSDDKTVTENGEMPIDYGEKTGKRNPPNKSGRNRKSGEKTSATSSDDGSSSTTKRKPSETTTETVSPSETTTNSVVPAEPTTNPGSDYTKPYVSDVMTESEEYLNAIEPYAISRHQYPKYPLHYAFSDGSGKDFNTRWREYFESRQYKRQFINLWKPATGFIKNSTSVFLAESKGENLVYSPANVYFALSLLAETTGGNSRQQVLNVLGENDISSLRKTANGIWNFNYSDDGATRCLLGNSIWLNNENSYNKDALDILANNYYASSFSGKMGSEGYDNAFRQWVNTQTGNLLENQVSEFHFQPDTDFVLASTILFKVKWSYEFNTNKTYKQDFNTPKKTVSTDFMHEKMGDSNLYYGDKFTSVYLPFDMGGGMEFILPDEGYTPEALLGDYETLDYMVSNVYTWSKSKTYDINCSIPKFDISSKMELIPGMKKLGITDCFDSSKADFSPICKQNMGAVSKIQHGARVMIDEEGVTATAYTVELKIGGIPADQPDYDFTLDRPFIFVIKGIDGLPLFIGIVNNP